MGMTRCLSIPSRHGHKGHKVKDPARQYRDTREELHLRGGGCLAVPEEADLVSHGGRIEFPVMKLSVSSWKGAVQSATPHFSFW